MGEIAAIAGGGGVLAALVAVVGYLLASNRADRQQYEQALEKAEARADAAEQRAREAWQVADEARKARHATEDALSRQRRKRGEPR